MITLEQDQLVFRFPEVHPDAILRVEFQRTLRIPDDEKQYSLPPGLGRFPLQHVDDHASRVPRGWLDRGGVMLPMYQSEALWVNFVPHHVSQRRTGYPFAVKIAAGKINAVTGDSWSEPLQAEPQDYTIIPKQPWLDGYCVEKGIIRQFVAMPLGSGYSAEEQITGTAEHGGIQVVAFPMKADVFERRYPERSDPPPTLMACRTDSLFEPMMSLDDGDQMDADMGLAPGGQMQQEVYDDPFEFADWNDSVSSRCFVHLSNSLVWSAFTGSPPPTVPPTAREYSRAGLPWFDYYDDDAVSVDGSSTLQALESVVSMGKKKEEVPLPENQSVEHERVVRLRKGLRPGQVREGAF